MNRFDEHASGPLDPDEWQRETEAQDAYDDRREKRMENNGEFRETPRAALPEFTPHRSGPVIAPPPAARPTAVAVRSHTRRKARLAAAIAPEPGSPGEPPPPPPTPAEQLASAAEDLVTKHGCCSTIDAVWAASDRIRKARKA